mgnify:CR=1 FL=1
MSYIDLHCHTIQIKKGESKNRNVTKEKFISSLIKSNVSVVAITNHNYFDFKQYADFKDNDSEILVLPGIELDVMRKNQEIGHCVLVSNPDKINHFFDFIDSEGLSQKTNAEEYTISLQDFVIKTQKIDGLFLIHYDGKKPYFSEEDYLFLKDSLVGDRLFLEPSNLTSAFVYMSAGYKCLIGSDIKNWDNYPGKTLPELKIQIGSFNSLKLLLKKDENAIQEHLEKTLYSENFEIKDSIIKDLHFSIPVYRDINVIIGGKSTGKSIILSDIYETLSKDGKANQTKYFKASAVDDEFKKIKDFVPQKDDVLLNTDNNDYSNEIERIKNFKISLPDNIFTKIQEFLLNRKREMAKKLGFVSTTSKFTPDKISYEEKVSNLNNDLKKIITFQEAKLAEKYLSNTDTCTFKSLLIKIETKIKEEIENQHIAYYSKFLAEKSIQTFKSLFEKTKGISAMPSTTGFVKFYQSMIHAKNDLVSLSTILSKSFSVRIDLGFIEGKGNVSLLHQIDFDGTKKNESKEKWNSVSGLTVTNCKKIKRSIERSINLFGEEDFLKAVPEIGKLLSDQKIQSIFDFCFYRCVFERENHSFFEPSSGDKSSLVLANLLNSNCDNTDFYLLDEPEMSVGHDYVTNIIIPRLKELAKLKKTIFVVTHDANIAVCTLPYQTIYRLEDSSGYKTYIGNVFTDKLTNINKSSDVLKWTETSLKVLEGGADVFSLREETYGKALKS